MVAAGSFGTKMSALEDDFSDFYDDDIETVEVERDAWHVLIVDDEHDVHQATEFALKSFQFEGRKLSFTNAYSAEQALKILSDNQQFALMFIDVVMESETAGLELIKTIRNELQNTKLRLILRTGQPGFAPEDEVIREYDINDYRNKAELTASKLKNACYTALRSYRDLCALERSQLGLAQIISATSQLQAAETHQAFAANLLMQIANVTQIAERDLVASVVVKEQDTISSQPCYRVLASSNNIETFEQIPEHIKAAYRKVESSQESEKLAHEFVGIFKTSNDTTLLLYVSSENNLGYVEHNLLAQFSNSLAVSYENIHLRLSVQESQKEITYLLGEAVEKRSKETGSHVKRVANYCYLLAKAYGLSEQVAHNLKAASPLHDIGKIAIPDNILNKPGKLTAEEWQVMRTHASQGCEMLAKSNNEVLKMAAIIAAQHHEKWDGSGYPNGLKGEEIHIVGRLTAIADVYDALSHKRSYKEAWPETDVLSLIRENKGTHFDPKLVDLFFENIDKIRAIKESLPD